MTRTRKVAIGVFAVIGVAIAALVAVVALFDWNRARPMINERVSAAIRRPFAINGDLSVRWAREPDEGGWRGWVPWPHVSAQDISVGNAPWAKAPAFATLKRGEFSLSPLPLLSQRVVIRRIQLTEPAADLERLADGRANWQFTMPDTGEPSPWVLDINEIGFDKGQVGLRDEILKADLTLQVDPLGKPVPFADVAGADFAPQAPADGAPAAGSPTSPPAPPRELVRRVHAARLCVRLEGLGQVQDLPVRARGKVGGMLAMQDASQPFPVQADLSVGGTRAAVVGTLRDPASLAALDLRLKLSGGSMAQLYPLTGVTLPDTPPYSTDGHLVARLRRQGGAVFDYKDFNGKVGNSDLHGDVSFALGAPRPG